MPLLTPVLVVLKKPVKRVLRLVGWRGVAVLISISIMSLEMNGCIFNLLGNNKASY